jgi:hypothetical protein
MSAVRSPEADNNLGIFSGYEQRPEVQVRVRTWQASFLDAMFKACPGAKGTLELQ